MYDQHDYSYGLEEARTGCLLCGESKVYREELCRRHWNVRRIAAELLEDESNWVPREVKKRRPSRAATVKQAKLLTDYAKEIAAKRVELRKRADRAGAKSVIRYAMAAENRNSQSWTQEWYEEAFRYVPKSGASVAKQLARLAGDDFDVTVTWKSLAEAIGKADKLGRPVAYTQRGVKTLEEAGWLSRTVTGKGRGAKTVFHLQVGDIAPWSRKAINEQVSCADDPDESQRLP